MLKKTYPMLYKYLSKIHYAKLGYSGKYTCSFENMTVAIITQKALNKLLARLIVFKLCKMNTNN